jgi:hypothetical protein
MARRGTSSNVSPPPLSDLYGRARLGLIPDQNGGVSRRNTPRRGSRSRREDARPFSIGSHWRADGAPKAVFGSQREALRAANVSRIESGATLNAYECDFCSRWHLGSTTGREH